MMKSMLFVTVLLSCFAYTWGEDLSFSVGDSKVEVLGRSGKIEFSLNANTSFKIEMDNLYERDNSLNLLKNSGPQSGRHSFQTFSNQDFTFGDLGNTSFNGVDALTATFEANLLGSDDDLVNLKIIMYMFTQSGVVKDGNNTFAVAAGAFKFNYIISSWPFCDSSTTDNSFTDCDGEHGAFLDLDFNLKPTGLGNHTVGYVDLGGNTTVAIDFEAGQMLLPSEYMVESAAAYMPMGFPSVTDSGDKIAVTLRWNRFGENGESLYYDPLMSFTPEDKDENEDVSNDDNDVYVPLANNTYEVVLIDTFGDSWGDGVTLRVVHDGKISSYGSDCSCRHIDTGISKNSSSEVQFSVSVNSASLFVQKWEILWAINIGDTLFMGDIDTVLTVKSDGIIAIVNAASFDSGCESCPMTRKLSSSSKPHPKPTDFKFQLGNTNNGGWYRSDLTEMSLCGMNIPYNAIYPKYAISDKKRKNVLRDGSLCDGDKATCQATLPEFGEFVMRINGYADSNVDRPSMDFCGDEAVVGDEITFKLKKGKCSIVSQYHADTCTHSGSTQDVVETLDGTVGLSSSTNIVVSGADSATHAAEPTDSSTTDVIHVAEYGFFVVVMIALMVLVLNKRKKANEGNGLLRLPDNSEDALAIEREDDRLRQTNVFDP